MPAAAVIPAPIAYINVVAVKKLVVEVMGCALKTRCAPESTNCPAFINLEVGFVVSFTVNKLGCLKQAYV